MVHYRELMIGDWIEVNDTPRQVAAITKKKVGYHIEPNECRMHYARLSECKPIKIQSIKEVENRLVVNDSIKLNWNPNIQRVKFTLDATCEYLYLDYNVGSITKNNINELHILQHLILFPTYSPIGEMVEK